MNNFRKYCICIITFADEHPQGGGESRVGASPPPTWKDIYLGGLFPLLGGLLFYLENMFTPLWGDLVSPFRVIFSMWTGFFYTYVEKFVGLIVPLTKISPSAQYVARVVANYYGALGALGEIVRLNLLIHFGAHFHIMLRNQ